MIKITPTMSSAPSTNVSTSFFSGILLTIPMIIAIIKNQSADSLKYQFPNELPVNQPVNPSKNVIPNSPHGMNPIIMIKKVSANRTKVTFCFPFNEMSSSISSLPYFFSIFCCSLKLRIVDPLSFLTFLAYFITK